MGSLLETESISLTTRHSSVRFWCEPGGLSEEKIEGKGNRPAPRSPELFNVLQPLQQAPGVLEYRRSGPYDLFGKDSLIDVKRIRNEKDTVKEEKGGKARITIRSQAETDPCFLFTKISPIKIQFNSFPYTVLAVYIF